MNTQVPTLRQVIEQVFFKPSLSATPFQDGLSRSPAAFWRSGEICFVNPGPDRQLVSVLLGRPMTRNIWSAWIVSPYTHYRSAWDIVLTEEPPRMLHLWNPVTMHTSQMLRAEPPFFCDQQQTQRLRDTHREYLEYSATERRQGTLADHSDPIIAAFRDVYRQLANDLTSAAVFDFGEAETPVYDSDTPTSVSPNLQPGNRNTTGISGIFDLSDLAFAASTEEDENADDGD